MSFCRAVVLATALIWSAACAVSAQQASVAAQPKQDPVVLAFAERVAPWYPGSSFKIVADEHRFTPSGRYRMLQVERSCDNQYLAGTSTLAVDEVTSVAWYGNALRLGAAEQGIDLRDLRGALESLLPEAMLKGMRLRARVVWDSGGARSGALIPFTLMIDTGYAEYPKPVAVSSDGEYVLLGASFPFDEDPVAFRRRLLTSSSQAVWDHPSRKAKVEIVEFSDFECPGCRSKWPTIKKAIEVNGSLVRHGMVNLPLTSIHPWAFRAATAAWCIAQQDAEATLALKELFYSLQQEMRVSDVTSTALDFVEGNGLDVDVFKACYLKSPSISGVVEQIALANRLGVNATPTYFINGWQVQVPDESWLLQMIERLAVGKEP